MMFVDTSKRMISIIILIFALVFAVDCEVCSSRCYAGQGCFPGVQELVEFNSTIDGTLMFPTDEYYHTAILMHNVYYTKFPAVIVYVKSTEDVKTSVLFARKYNLHVTIWSSGHDFIGRSTGHGSFQINLSKMTNTHVDLNSTRNAAGTMTIESAATWAQVYKEVDAYNRVIVGGSAHTVTQGGYTQGGGHSPLSRPLGLAVDQVLEMTVVTSDGRIVNVTGTGSTIENLDGSISKSSDTDLFWALRGGGGGTFGIVTSYTYKLHMAPKQMVVAQFGYLLSYDGNSAPGKIVMNFYTNFLKTLPKEWGGYMLASNNVFPLDGGHHGTGVFFLFNHFGEWNSPSRQAIDQWKSFHPEWQTSWSLRNVSSFWEYEVNVTDADRYSSYLMGTFVQREHLNSNFSDFFADAMAEPITAQNPMPLTCTGIHIGGKVSDADPNDTPVHPGFRSGLISMGCSYLMDPMRIHFTAQKGMEFYNKMKVFGNGVYLNEASADLQDWKDQFWGPHYPRLLSIKKKWDPDNFFTCLHCVGSEENLHQPQGTQSPTHIPNSGVNIVGK